MSPLLKYLQVEGYRSIKKLHAGPFGRVNLITGQNNVGKSSLLEAIRILVTAGDPDILKNILNYREEDTETASEDLLDLDFYDSFPCSSLFYGYPSVGECVDPIRISGGPTRSEAHKDFVSLKLSWYREEFDENSGRRIVPMENSQASFFDEAERLPYLEIKGPDKKNIVSLNGRAFRPSRFDGQWNARRKCIFVDPFSSRPTNKLSALWDSIALKDPQEKVIKALRFISDDILAITMVGDERSRLGRKAIAKSFRHSKPIPLRSFGDGLNRWLGILIALANVGGGVLLVDEIETGIHYTVQKNLWRAIFEIAEELNVQVFATTHSWDCIESFQSVANESKEEGSLLRLSDHNGNIHSTMFNEDELKIASRDSIEIR